MEMNMGVATKRGQARLSRAGGSWLLSAVLVGGLLSACGGGGQDGAASVSNPTSAAASTQSTNSTSVGTQTNSSAGKTPAAQTRWATTWEAAMLQNTLQNYTSDTARTRIHTSAGGSGVRIRLSNIYGSQPMVLDTVNVALPDSSNTADPTAIDTTTMVPVTFNNGESFAEVMPGEELLSDPITMNVPKLSDLDVTMHFNGLTQYADGHSDTVTPLPGLYVVRSQNVATNSTFSGLSYETYNGAYNLSEVEVQVPAATREIIAMSESITDGRGAVGIEHPWPAVLASLSNAGKTPVAIGNAGIGGNSMFDSNSCCGVSLLDRFQRDVLSRNPTDIVLLAGDNDLASHSATDIIARYQVFIETAHAQGIKVYGGVNTPIGNIVGTDGSSVSTGFYSPATEATRDQINAWIQTPGNFDGVIDFSAVVGANPSSAPLGIATACYDPDSPIHMDNQGYTAMGTVAYDVIFGQKVKPAAPCNSLSFPPHI
jgi:hypothetical protein